MSCQWRATGSLRPTTDPASRSSSSSMDQESAQVLALQDIPPGLSSSDIALKSVLSCVPSTEQLSVLVDEEGRLAWNSERCVISQMKTSSDCHSCNCVLSRGSSPGTVVLRTTREIRRKESLTMWFSEDVLAAMDIPFLNPINIRGEKSYVCHRCDEKFEYPNPLKLHLARDCGSLGSSELWRRLGESCQGSGKVLQQVNFSFRLSAPRPSSEPPTSQSAFRPYLQVPRSQSAGFDKEDYLDRQAAHIETLVSNLGQSKQGHLCLYCGKLYSRKYGLKIHIRTHTGFKPLKCKYCLRPFGDPSNLNKHVRLHAESETPYKCYLCGKTLVRRRDLERHIKSRHHSEEIKL